MVLLDVKKYFFKEFGYSEHITESEGGSLQQGSTIFFKDISNFISNFFQKKFYTLYWKFSIGKLCFVNRTKCTVPIIN